MLATTRSHASRPNAAHASTGRRSHAWWLSVFSAAILMEAAVAAPAVPAVSTEPAFGTDAALLAFRERVKSQNPGTRIDQVSVSPIAGLYEVVMGKNVAYMDSTGRFALLGHVWDMQARRDLTADRKVSLDKIDAATLPKDLALRHVRGKGSRVLYVFADPQCGFCRQLEQTLQNLDDVTVYTFVTPILGPESKRVASAVACAADPAAAWSAWMLKGVPATGAANCDRPADAVEKLAQSLGITGTPTVIAADGRKYAGAMPTAQLSAWLAEGSTRPEGPQGAVKVTAPVLATEKTAARSAAP